MCGLAQHYIHSTVTKPTHFSKKQSKSSNLNLFREESVPSRHFSIPTMLCGFILMDWIRYNSASLKWLAVPEGPQGQLSLFSWCPCLCLLAYWKFLLEVICDFLGLRRRCQQGIRMITLIVAEMWASVTELR